MLKDSLKWQKSKTERRNEKKERLNQKEFIKSYKDAYGPTHVIGKKHIKALRDINNKINNVRYDSKDLADKFNEIREIYTQINDAYFDWESDKELMKKSAEIYLKDRNKDPEDYSYYLNYKGADAYINVWAHYVETHPELKALSDKQWKIQIEYRDQAKKVFDQYLGAYGKQNISHTPTYKLELSEFISSKAEENMLDDLFSMPDLHGR